MPSRLAVLAIVGFWLSTTTWLIYREVLPKWQARQGQPPSIVVDVQHEIGSDFASWQIYLDGEYDGTGFSKVSREPDRSFIFQSELKFIRPLLGLVSKISSSYRVDEEKRLTNLSFRVRMPTSSPGKVNAQPAQPRAGVFDYLEFVLDGKVEDGLLKSSARWGDGDDQPTVLPGVALSDKSGVFNPMQMGNKFRGLYDGQSWRIPLLDPLAAALSRKAVSTELLANVSADQLEWAKQRVECFRIDFRKQAEDDPIASCWVRQRDGVVLQQQLKISLPKLELKLVRGN